MQQRPRRASAELIVVFRGGEEVDNIRNGRGEITKATLMEAS